MAKIFIPYVCVKVNTSSFVGSFSLSAPVGEEVAQELPIDCVGGRGGPVRKWVVGQCSAVNCNTVQCSAMHCIEVQCLLVQCNAL